MKEVNKEIISIIGGALSLVGIAYMCYFILVVFG